MAGPAEPNRPSRRSLLLAWGAVVLGGIFLWVCVACDNLLNIPILNVLASTVGRLTNGNAIQESLPTLLIYFVGALVVGPLIWTTWSPKIRRRVKYLGGGAAALAPINETLDTASSDLAPSMNLDFRHPF